MLEGMFMSRRVHEIEQRQKSEAERSLHARPTTAKHAANHVTWRKVNVLGSQKCSAGTVPARRCQIAVNTWQLP
jgi:hypothetical protein